MREYSISVSNDTHSEEHSRRSYTPKSAEKALQRQNIVILDCGNDRKAFNDFFEDAIVQYNSKQTRADRKKSLDYLQALERGEEGYGKGKTQEKVFYHSVVQIGNRDDNGVTDEDFDVGFWKQLKEQGKYRMAARYVVQHMNNSTERELMTQCLEEVGRQLERKYPYCKFWGITIHRDEPNGTDHMDMRYTIFTDGEKTGLSKRVSMNKGLAKMGFHSDGEKTALMAFQDAIKQDVEEAMASRGFSRRYMNNMEKHRSVSAFQMQKQKEQLADEVSALEAQKQNVLNDVQSIRQFADHIAQENIQTRQELQVRKQKQQKEQERFQEWEDALEAQKKAIEAQQQSVTDLATEYEQALLRVKAFEASLPPADAITFMKRFKRKVAVKEKDVFGHLVPVRDANGKMITREESCYEAYTRAMARATENIDAFIEFEQQNQFLTGTDYQFGE